MSFGTIDSNKANSRARSVSTDGEFGLIAPNDAEVVGIALETSHLSCSALVVVGTLGMRIVIGLMSDFFAKVIGVVAVPSISKEHDLSDLSIVSVSLE